MDEKKRMSILSASLFMIGLLVIGIALSGCRPQARPVSLETGGLEPRPAPSLALEVSGPATIGMPLKIDVVSEDMVEFSGVQVSVSYDPETLRFDKVEEGTFLNQGSQTFFFTINSTARPGLVKDIVIVRKDGNVKGKGLVASLYFTPLKSGPTTLDFADLMVTNNKVEKIDVKTVGTKVTIG
jgi:hypothetical protein